MLKHLNICQPCSTCSIVADTEVACQESLVNNQPEHSTVSTVSGHASRESPKRTNQKETIDIGWRGDIKIPEKYKAY